MDEGSFAASLRTRKEEALNDILRAHAPAALEGYYCHLLVEGREDEARELAVQWRALDAAGRCLQDLRDGGEQVRAAPPLQLPLARSIRVAWLLVYVPSKARAAALELFTQWHAPGYTEELYALYEACHALAACPLDQGTGLLHDNGAPELLPEGLTAVWEATREVRGLRVA